SRSVAGSRLTRADPEKGYAAGSAVVCYRPTPPEHLSGDLPNGGSNVTPYWRASARLQGRNDGRPDSLSRLDRRRLGGPVFPPQGLHTGVHHRTRLHGEADARVQ